MNRLLFLILVKQIAADIKQEEVQYLNELPIDKLIRLKNSLQDFVAKNEFINLTSTTPTYLDNFGAEALALQSVKSPVKRTDYEDGLEKKHEYSKMSNIFSTAITTLAFLAFAGYLLCLIVQAIRAKNIYNQNNLVQQSTPTLFFANSGIKKRPQPQFASYGRRKRDVSMELPPEQLFNALLNLCEGYAKWSERYN